MTNKVAIDVWAADLTFPGFMDRMHRLVAEFEVAHPDYRINLRGIDLRKVPEEVAQAAQHGNPPAIAEYYSYLTSVARDALAADGTPLFTSVEQALAGRTEVLGEPVVTDDIVAGIRHYYTHGNGLASMPVVATTMLLFGNADLLEKAGVTELPQTWSGVEAVCEAVRRLPDGPAHAITWPNHGFFIQQAVAKQGGKLSDQDDGRAGRATTVDLATEEVLTFVDWWRELHRKGHYVYTGKIPDWAGNLKAFADSEVALRITSSNDVNYMAQAAQNGGFQMVAGRFPHPDGAPFGGNIIAGTSLWLRRGLDPAVEDGALAFMQFLNNPRNAADQHRVNSFIPITNQAFALLEQEGWFDRYPHHRAGSDQLRNHPPGVAGAPAGPPPTGGAQFGDYAGVQDVMTQAMHDVLLHDADPATRFAQATAEAQQLLDAYHADCAGIGPHSPNSLRVEHFTGAEEYSGATLDKVVHLER